jgi:hypothetical protein
MALFRSWTPVSPAVIMLHAKHPCTMCLAGMLSEHGATTALISAAYGLSAEGPCSSLKVQKSSCSGTPSSCCLVNSGAWYAVSYCLSTLAC